MLERMMVAKRLQEISQMPQQPQQKESSHSQHQKYSMAQMTTHGSIAKSIRASGGDDSPELKIPDHMKPTSELNETMQSEMDVIKSEDFASEESDWSNNKDYSPADGFEVYFDYCSKVYPAFNQVRLTYVVQNVTQQHFDPLQVNGGYGTVDPINSNMRFCPVEKEILLKGIKSHPSCNLIIEVQVPKVIDEYEPPKWVAYGWTLINLFDYKRDLNVGIWRLPLYQCPTLVQIDVRDIPSLKLLQISELCIRISNAKEDFDQEIKRHDPASGERPEEYQVPDIHIFSMDTKRESQLHS